MRAFQTQSLRFVYDRLASLLRTLQLTDLDEFRPLQLVADYATLVSTYNKGKRLFLVRWFLTTLGFVVLMEPFNDRTPQIPDPVLRLCCLDASIALKPVLDKFR
jgi:DNA excision repair protein ERCC-2